MANATQALRKHELPGRFDGPAGSWGTNRIPVVLRSRR